MPLDSFPIIDFAKEKSDFESFSKSVLDATSSWGFFILANHGIPEVDRMFELVSSFLVTTYGPMLRV